MYIHRALLLAIGIFLVFLPSIAEWLTASDTAWYRPFQLWFVLIIAAYWNQRSGFSDEL